MENEQLDQESLNLEENETPINEEEQPDEVEKLRKVAENQKIRAEKAERELKQIKSQPPKEEPEVKSEVSISTKEQYELLKANIHPDDIDEIIDLARYKKIPVGEFLKTSIAKTIIRDKEEERQTAEASNVTPVRRGNGRNSDEALLKDVRSGKLPESSEDIARLWRIRKGLKA